MVEGTDGIISDTSFTSASADFLSANVQAGMVLCIYPTVRTEALCYEIISIDPLLMSLTVSVLRADRDADAVAPPPGAELNYYIHTFMPQIADCEATLREKLRQIGEADGISATDFVDSSQLRKAIAFAALSSVFTARASNAADSDANWVKAEFYRRRHVTVVGALRLAKDIDGDGFAEQTRTLANISLRRT